MAKFYLVIITESQKEAKEISSVISDPNFLLQVNDEIHDQEGVILHVYSPEVESLSKNPLPELTQEESTTAYNLFGIFEISILFTLAFCIVLNFIYTAWKRKRTSRIPEEVIKNRSEREDDVSMAISDSFSAEEDQRQSNVDENVSIEVQIN